MNEMERSLARGVYCDDVLCDEIYIHQVYASRDILRQPIACSMEQESIDEELRKASSVLEEARLSKIVSSVAVCGKFDAYPSYFFTEYYDRYARKSRGPARSDVSCSENRHTKFLEKAAPYGEGVVVGKREYDWLLKRHDLDCNSSSYLAANYPNGIVCDLELDRVVAIRAVINMGLELILQMEGNSPDGMIDAGWVLHHGCYEWVGAPCLEAAYYLLQVDGEGDEMVSECGSRILPVVDGDGFVVGMRVPAQSSWREAARAYLASLSFAAKGYRYSGMTSDDDSTKIPCYSNRFGLWWDLISSELGREDSKWKIARCTICGKAFIVQTKTKPRIRCHEHSGSRKAKRSC